MVFLSVPETYNFGVKYNDYDRRNKKWVTTRTIDVKAEDMKEYLGENEDPEDMLPVEDYISNGELPEDNPDDDLPF